LCLAIAACEVLPSLLKLVSLLVHPVEQAVLECLTETTGRHIHGDATVPPIHVLRSVPLFGLLPSPPLLPFIQLNALQAQGKQLGQQSRSKSTDDTDNGNYQSEDVTAHD
jgi:hypothetical protein